MAAEMLLLFMMFSVKRAASIKAVLAPTPPAGLMVCTASPNAVMFPDGQGALCKEERTGVTESDF